MRQTRLALVLVSAALLLGGAKRSKTVSMVFEGITAPSALAEKQVVRSTSKVTIDGTDHTLGFIELARDGNLIGEHRIGVMTDRAGDAIQWPAGGDRVCTRADGATLLEVEGAPHLVSHYECTPAVVYDTTLRQDAAGGLTAVTTQPIDFSGVGGTVNACAASATPWGTHLGSEEYEADVTKLLPDGTVEGNHEGYNWSASYHGGTLHEVHPYALGWTPEVDVATGTVVKHYSMGRFSHEQAIVLPDQRTVYLSDDGTNNGFFLFVADEAGDLSAGVLYAARFDQDGDTFGLRWISLGHASNADIVDATDGVPFESLFLRAKPTSDGGCPDGFVGINTSWKHECLAEVPEGRRLASRLETRRFAAVRGATTELRKAEGMAWDPDNRRVYLAVSSVGRGMLPADPIWDAGRTSGDHIALEPNHCGTVYGGEVARKVQDTDGVTIDSAFVLTGLRPIVQGVPEGERCTLDGMANPDNIAWIPRAKLLLIAEDTGKHDNNALWAVDIAGDVPVLTRLLTTPLGAEVAGLNWFPDVGGWGYLTVSVQNPFGVHPWLGSSYEGGIPKGANRSHLGVLGPFPRF